VMYAYYNQVKVSTDQGLIFTSKNDEKTFQSDYMFNDVNMLTDEIIYHVYIMSSYSQRIYYRQYMKLQELLANIGGISKSFLLLGIIITYQINQAKIYELIMNSLFEFSEVTTKDKEHVAEGRFSLSYLEILRMKMPCCLNSKALKKKKEFFNAVIDETEKYLDYVDILKSLQDIVKLKAILLNKDQQKIFEKMKFKWALDSIPNSSLNLKFRFSKNQKYSEHELTESYNAINNNKNNEVNKMILEFMK
jgi:hypothetical protein